MPESGEPIRIRQSYLRQPVKTLAISTAVIGGCAIQALYFPMFSESGPVPGDLIRYLDDAVRMYALDHGGRKPTTLEELAEPTFDSETGYLQSNTVPLDPWGNPFIYRPPTEPTGDDYEIISLGNDGAVGGSGHAADIKLSELRDR